MRTSTAGVEHFRITVGKFKSTSAFGMNGHFLIPDPHKRCRMFVIATNQMGWDHVSVSIVNEKRTPTWGEMCHVKKMFWEDSECVIQYHPAEQDYVNWHEFVLHLWKPIGVELPKPPKIFV